MTASIWADLAGAGLPSELVVRLEAAYTGVKENYFLARHRPGELEGGIFAEVALRIVQWATGGLPGGSAYTALGTSLAPFNQEVRRLELLPPTNHKSLRIHIPRVLTGIHDIRNSRGVGHPGGDVDPNLADATFITSAVDWVLAEFLRLFHQMPLDEAQHVVDTIVQRRTPLVQMFGTFPKVLRADLKKSESALVLLYHPGMSGATSGDLAGWLRVTVKECRRILRRHDERALVHFDPDGDRAYLTVPGMRMVESLVPK